MKFGMGWGGDPAPKLASARLNALACLLLAQPPNTHWSRILKKLPKNWKNRLFHKNRFFDNFKLNMGGLGVSGGVGWTVRTDSLELWRDLVLHGMGEVDFHVLPKRTYEYNQLTFSISIRFLNYFFDKMDSPNRHFLTKWLPFLEDFPWIFHGGRGSGRQISRPGSLGRALKWPTQNGKVHAK